MASAKQTGRRCPAFRQQVRRLRGGFVVKVGEDLLDHHRVFDAGNDSERTGTFPAGLDVDVENALQSLRPGHRGPAFGGRLGLRLIERSGFVALAPFGRRHRCTVFAVRGQARGGAAPIVPPLKKGGIGGISLPRLPFRAGIFGPTRTAR